MSWLDGVKHRLVTLLHPGRHERELLDEMRLHEELGAMHEGNVGAGRRRFGNRTWYQEETRRMTWLGHLDVMRQDIAYAWRSIVRNPGLTAMVIITLALGLGVNAATFTFLDRLYLRPPDGVMHPDGLRRYWFETSAERSYDGRAFVSAGVSYPVYRAIAEASGSPARFALYDTDLSLYMRRGGEKVRLRGVFATASYFSVLGVRPELGRLYRAEEDVMGAGVPVVVLGHRFWQRQTGGDSSIIGSVVNIEHTDYTVVGVMQREFDGLDLQAMDVWIPLASIPTSHWMAARARWWEGDRVNGMAMLERNGDGTFPQQATAVLRRANVALRGPQADTLARALVGPLVGTGPGREGQDMKIAKGLGAVALIILLIACANVINLLLARAEQRRREVAVRLALGVSRARLMRLIATEPVILALLAGGVAVLAAAWGGSLLRTLLFPGVVWYESPLHWRVVVFALALAMMAGVVAGTIPALQSRSPGLTHALKEGAREGRPRGRLRATLVMTQAALSVMLLAGAALFVQSLRNVQNIDIGYDASRLVFAWVSFEPEREMPPSTVDATLDELQSRVATRPGIESVARADMIPMRGFSFAQFWFDGDSSLSLRPNPATFMPVSATFFRTVGMAFVRGRTFVEGSGAPREVVINDEMARRLWPADDAVGRCIRFGERDAPCHTVVGVVETGRQGYVIEEDPKPIYYLSIDDPAANSAGTMLVVRMLPEAERAARVELRNAMTKAFPLGEVQVEGMLEALDGEYRPWRLGATLFTAFGLLALIVAMVGIYSTVSYGVSQRSHEFGVRAALGARVGDIVRHVLAGGLRVVLGGVLLGVALTLAAGRLVAAMLYGVRASDPLTLATVGAALLLAAAIAAMVPAWRAARVDPVQALRAD